MVGGYPLTPWPTHAISRMLGGAPGYSLTPLPPSQLAPELAGCMGLGKSIASESACCWNAPVFGSLASGVWSGKPPSSAIQLTRMVRTAGVASCAGSPEVGERYFPLLGSWYPQPTWKRSRLGTPHDPWSPRAAPGLRAQVTASRPRLK